MPDRLVVDLGGDGQAAVLTWPDGGMPEEVARAPLEWPLDEAALEDLRWYLEDYLLAPFGVWEERGPAVRARLHGWGDQVFESVFGGGPARYAYERARDRGLEVVFRSANPLLLGLPWELMRDGAGPVALGKGGISRSVPVSDRAGTLEVPGGKLRVLMVISRPGGTNDVGYQMVARPLLERLDAVRGEVDLTVLRPPTFDALAATVKQAADNGEPFHVVHFDGHGVMTERLSSGGPVSGRPPMMTGTGEGRLAFEQPDGGSDLVGSPKVAAALAAGKVPVVVLNACQSGAVGKELEASVATALLHAGCAAVVAMAYSVYAVAAAEFMAAFYESLFAGESVGQAVTIGRKRLQGHDGRPSPKGDMPLADWLVPVHYMRREVRFPDARTSRPAAKPSLDAALDKIRVTASGTVEAQDPLAAVGGFVGRDDLFYQLESAARRQRVVVLTGPGGTGKTELAKGFARWWRDTGGVDDPRLVLWHSFEPGVASFGLDGVITEIGLTVFGTDFARLDQPQRLDVVKQVLGEYRALLIWDNFESVHEMPDPTGATPPLDEVECTRLREFLAWMRDHSASTVVITSRAREEWLGELRRITVSGLNWAEAAQYADHLLAPFPAARRRRERRSFGELLDWLDGHPLAMRLTLPRLDTDDPAALLAALQGTTSLAADEGAGGRLSSLDACISYSYAHLSEQTRRLLPAISLFHGTACLAILAMLSVADEAPGRFAGVSGEVWWAALEDATQVGLLISIGGAMYQIHPALPSYLVAEWRAVALDYYGQERDASEQALRAACAVFGDLMVQQVGSGDAALAYIRIAWNRRTLDMMLRHALDHHAWDDARSIVAGLSLYWSTRGLHEEADAWADRIINATTRRGEAAAPMAESLWLHAITDQATRHKDAGRWDQAECTYQQVLSYLQDQPETDWIRANFSDIYHQLGMLAQDRGRLDEADAWYRKSLVISEERGDRLGMSLDYGQLGQTAWARGQLDEAEAWYHKSLAISEEVGNRPSMARAYHHLGMVARNRGRLGEAEAWYRKSLAISKELGDLRYLAGTYSELGQASQDCGRLDEAEAWYRRSLAIAEGVGDRPGRARIYHHLGMVAQDRGRLGEAEAWYHKSLTISEELGDLPRTVGSCHQLGMMAHRKWRLDDAEGWYRKSLTISEKSGYRLGVAGSCHFLGLIAQGRARLDDAESWYRKSLAISEELDGRPYMAATNLRLGVVAEVRGKASQALEWNIRCVSLSSEFPSPLTGTGPSALVRLTGQLGLPALEEGWRRVTGEALPEAVRDYVTSRLDEAQPGET